MSNRNVLWTDVFVDELARAGLKSVCIAPGSRSTPLTLAFARHGGVRIYTHLDERSAAFFALGLALASDEPVALVCTSGTAAANFFPAIVEAHMSRVPLIVLTADRPPELRHSGANQTIDQIKMYGDYALWSVDAPLPEASPAALTIRSLRTLAARAYAKANGIRKGVVHINMPFRKPLEPIPVAGDATEVPKGAVARDYQRRYTDITLSELTGGYEHVLTTLEKIMESPRGIIVCGRDALLTQPSEVGNLGYYTSYPIFADTLSGQRFQRTGYPQGFVSAYDTFIPYMKLPEPDFVLHIGEMPLSASMQSYLEKIKPKHRIALSKSGDWNDFNFLIDTFIQCNASLMCFEVKERIKEHTGADVAAERLDWKWSNSIQRIEQITWQVIDEAVQVKEYFDGAAVYDVVELIPPDSTLFVGNSLPVRLLDQFGKPQNKPIHVYANRGASGIDGNISTALGAGAARPDKPLVAIVGDITFYHDMNGLLAVQRNGVPVTIVLLNNDGGGIFHRLPIKDFEPAFTDLFVMPHGLEFEHAAKLYGLEYVRTDERETFRQAFSESVNNRLSRVIEVRTEVQHDLKRRQDIMDTVQQRIAELNL